VKWLENMFDGLLCEGDFTRRRVVGANAPRSSKE
jgi:hypothetical protein